jgi:hypothetical protein
MLRDVTAWVLTDGKAGDEVQCLGVTDALGLTPDIRRVAPRPAFAWAMPWGPIDPRDAPAREGRPTPISSSPPAAGPCPMSGPCGA